MRMKGITYEEWKKYKCAKLGHDWAFQDCHTFMTKVCLRCGAKQYFFPEDDGQELKE